jgi:hypothetical protein
MEEVELGTGYTWRAARDAGATRRQIEQDGVRLGHGLYLSRAAEPDLATRCLAWLRVFPPSAVFGHGTAAGLMAAPLGRPPAVHVIVPAGTPVPHRRGLVTHERTLDPEDVVALHGLPVTSGAQTFLDLAATLPAGELVAVGDALLRTGHLTADALGRRLARAGRVRGVVRARECAPVLDGAAMSRPESLLRYWLTASPLPTPETQVPVEDADGRIVAHGDLGYRRWRVLLEYEGRHHAVGDQFDRDVDRYSLMATGGWLTLRFARRHLHPGVVVSRTRSTLLSRGWRPPTRLRAC